MGNSASSTELRVQDAWAIATAWHPQIRSIMGLRGEFPAEEPEAADGYERPPVPPILLRNTYTITTSVEFVEFVFSSVEADELPHVVLAARAATLAWFALSCCPGFGAHENPDFWWRVFTPPHSSSTKYPGRPRQMKPFQFIPLTSHHKFFPNHKRPFPSVRVADLDATAWQLFLFGSDPEGKLASAAWQLFPLGNDPERKLASAMETLEHFINESCWNRALPVAARTDDIRSLTQLLVGVTTSQLPTLARTKQLSITEVHCLSDSDAGPSEINALLDANPNLDVVISNSVDAKCVLADDSDVPPSYLRGQRPRVRVETLHLWSARPRTESETAAFFEKSCSLLPHTDVIEGVQVIARTEDENVLSDVNVAWLGYAIFHPDVHPCTSTFNNLKLYLGPASASVLPILKLMAQGNNLLVATGISTAVSTAYYQALVRAGTRVYSTNQRDDTGVLLTVFDSDIWVTVCFENPEEASLETTEASVRVIVPGIGIGWVDTSSILDVRTLPPSVSRVHRLRLVHRTHLDNTMYDIRGTDLVGVLSVLGSRLEYLDLDRSDTFLPDELFRILQCCPNLTKLRVRHDGACWSDPNGTDLPANQRLEELELVVPALLKPLVAPQLASLRVFHVIRPWPRMYSASARAFTSLMRHCPRLETLVWCSNDLALAEPQDSLGVFERSIATDTTDLALVPLNVSSRVAFLSVVRAFAEEQPRHPLGRIGDEDIANLIFSFSSSYMKRQVHINDLPGASKPR